MTQDNTESRSLRLTREREHGRREAAVEERESVANLVDQSLGKRASAMEARSAALDAIEAHNGELRSVNEKLVMATLAAQELRDEAQAARRQQDEFLAMLAHELRNPLAPIRTAVELLERLDGRPIPARVLQALRRQVEQMVRLLDDLLDASRVTHGKVVLRRRATAVTEFLEPAIETCAEALASKHQRLEIDLPPAPVFIDGDPVRLTQIMSNLLQNAVKYTQDGGEIAVSARQHGAVAIIRVRDNGIGISPEALPLVFDLFTQDERALSRAQGGLGIGLTVVRRMVELHGGTVEALSGGREQGSEFIVTLPCIEREAAHDGLVEAVARPAPAAARILVVEDNVDAGDILAALLGMSGHDVTLARDGETALEAFGRTRPQIVLCDIGLPGMDGYEVASRMRARGDAPRPSIIALTGYSTDRSSEKAIEAGFDDYVVKPVDPEALLTLVDATLRFGASHRDGPG